MSASVSDLHAATRRARAVKQAAQARLRRLQAAIAAGEAYEAAAVLATAQDAALALRSVLWNTAPASTASDTGIPAGAIKAMAREALGAASGLMREGADGGLFLSDVEAAEAKHADALARLDAIL